MLPRWEPFREILSLRETIDRLFDEGITRPRGWLTSWQTGVGTFPMDIYEDGTNLIVIASAPGFSPDNLHIRVRDGVLTLSGEAHCDEDRKDESYHLREHRYGRFERSVILPCPVNVEQAEAVFEYGVITVTLPKAEVVRAKRAPRLERGAAPA